MQILASFLFGFLFSCLPPLTFQNSLHFSMSIGQKVSSWKKQEWAEEGEGALGCGCIFVGLWTSMHRRELKGEQLATQLCEVSWPAAWSTDLLLGLHLSIWMVCTSSPYMVFSSSLPTTIVLLKTLALKSDLTTGSATPPGNLLEVQNLRLYLGPYGIRNSWWGDKLSRF